MYRKQPPLDADGFPIPPGFDDGRTDATSRPRGPFVRSLLRMLVLGSLLVGLSAYFDWPGAVRRTVGDYLAQQAVRQYRRNDLSGALRSLDRAVSWSPTSRNVRRLRVQLKLELKDFEGALADVLALTGQDPRDVAALDLQRHLLHVVHRHREAAALAGEMLDRGLGERAGLLNDRAYARALGKFELEAALKDIDEALSLTVDDSASLVDTRGYVLLQLGRPGEALAEFERAIETVLGEKEEFEQQRDAPDDGERLDRNGRRASERFDQHLAVMYQHRSEAHAALGDQAQARKDAIAARDLGYDPASGVY